MHSVFSAVRLPLPVDPGHDFQWLKEIRISLIIAIEAFWLSYHTWYFLFSKLLKELTNANQLYNSYGYQSLYNTQVPQPYISLHLISIHSRWVSEYLWGYDHHSLTIGNGVFATIWLVRDLKNPTLKICVLGTFPVPTVLAWGPLKVLPETDSLLRMWFQGQVC